MNYKEQAQLETRIQELGDLYGFETCNTAVYGKRLTITVETTKVKIDWPLQILQHYFPCCIYGPIVRYETQTEGSSGRKFARFSINLPSRRRIDAAINRLVDAVELATALERGDETVVEIPPT